MIPRYEKTEISRIWSEDSKFQTLLEVELAILQAQEESPKVDSKGVTRGSKIPAGTSDSIRNSAQIRPQRIAEIESQVHHDIIAFCTSITEQLPAEIGKYFHFGVTSSDIIDTAMTLQIKRSLEVIMGGFEKLLRVLWDKSHATRDIMSLGRSHGMYAEPMSFGQKLLGHYAEFSRRYQELKEYLETECTAQFSGAVGNYTILTPAEEERAAKILGLKVEPVSTQVIPRDRVGKLLAINALLASAIERLSVEIRHLHRSEVGEVQEGFSPGQKGSSTMPHKKNPIAGENLTGMARVLRSHVLVGLENIVLWHERDISHSSAERLVLPDNLGLLFYSLERMRRTLEQLEVRRDIIEHRVEETFNYLSSFYLHFLLERTPLGREEAYKIVQEAAFATAHEQGAEAFRQGILKRIQEKGLTVELPQITRSELKSIYLKHVEDVFQRTLRAYPLPQ